MKRPLNNLILDLQRQYHTTMAPHQRYTQQVNLLRESLDALTALRDLLRERVFWTANRKEFDRQGYSMLVNEETAIRDVNYRNAPLYATADEAIEAALGDLK